MVTYLFLQGLWPWGRRLQGLRGLPGSMGLWETRHVVVPLRN